jgi:hypothetical protein
MAARFFAVKPLIPCIVSGGGAGGRLCYPRDMPRRAAKRVFLGRALRYNALKGSYFRGVPVKQIIGGIVAASLALAPAFANAACFTDAEWRAAHVRVLQTDLQVAALECTNVAGHSYNDEYNTFIARMSDRLRVEATELKAHFYRVFGRTADREIDNFVTKVANDASGRSMEDMSFCANSAPLFQTALAIETPELEQAALDHVTDHSAIGELCPASPKRTKPVKAVATASPK